VTQIPPDPATSTPLDGSAASQLTAETAAYGPLVPFAFTVVLALVHVASGSLQSIGGRERERWLSASGGAFVAYVFVLLLPEVSEAALTASRFREEAFLAEQRVYVAALLGFVAFYGVEVVVSQRTGESAEEADVVFWFHVAVFTLYSGLIGYLLFHQEAPGFLNLAFYVLAMALHFLVTDDGLRRHHGAQFSHIGRWVLAAGTLAGGVLGLTIEVSGLGLWLAFGFVAGALVLNIVKEELPEADEGRFLTFAAGAAAYSLVIVFT
jgi:hypothetical protein